MRTSTSGRSVDAAGEVGVVARSSVDDLRVELDRIDLSGAQDRQQHLLAGARAEDQRLAAAKQVVGRADVVKSR